LELVSKQKWDESLRYNKFGWGAMGVE